MMRKSVWLCALVFCGSLLSGCIMEVEEGTVGVVKRFGKIQDEALGPSMYFWVP